MAYLLVVDDDLDFAQSVATVLRSEGHEIAIETDSEKTLQRIAQRRPDAIILDVVFPENEQAGFEVADDVWQTCGDLPILLLTAVRQQFPGPHRHQGPGSSEPPAAEFMEKPVDLQTLKKKVAQILAAHTKSPS